MNEDHTIAEFTTGFSPADVERELKDIIIKLRARGESLDGVDSEEIKVSRRGHGTGVVEVIVIAAISAAAKKAVDAAW